MDRIPFTLRMGHQCRVGAKCETRRGFGKRYKAGQVYLIATQHIRPNEGVLNPFNLETMQEWVEREGKRSQTERWSMMEEGRSIHMLQGWKPCGELLLPAWAATHGIEVTDVFSEAGARIDERTALREGFDTLAEFETYLGGIRPTFRTEQLQVIRFKVLTIEEVAAQGKITNLLSKTTEWPESWPQGWKHSGYIGPELTKAIESAAKARRDKSQKTQSL